MARIITRITNAIIYSASVAVCAVADRLNLDNAARLNLTKRLHKLDRIILHAVDSDEARAYRAYIKARYEYADAASRAAAYRSDVRSDAYDIKREEATQAKEQAIARTKAADAAFQAQITANVRSFDAKHAALMAAHKAEAKARQHCKDCGGTFGNGEVS